MTVKDGKDGIAKHLSFTGLTHSVDSLVHRQDHVLVVLTNYAVGGFVS